MRSVDGRKFADIYDQLAKEFVYGDPARIRDIAVLRFAAERALAVGDFNDIVRLHNTIERKETRLRASLKARQLERAAESHDGLRSKLSSRYPTKGGGASP
jgi:hypothetical protein